MAKGRCRHTICEEARREVAREIFAEIKKIEKRLLKRIKDCEKGEKDAGWCLELRREYEGEIEGIELCTKELAELKKKYTEGCDD